MKIGRNIAITKETLLTYGYDYAHLSYYQGSIDNESWVLMSVVPTNITNTIVIGISQEIATTTWAIYLKNNTSVNVDVYCLWINKS